MSSSIQLRRRWSSCRHGRNNGRSSISSSTAMPIWTVSTITNDQYHEEMVMKYGLPALLSLMALKYQQGTQSITPFETHPWLMSISIFGMLLYFSSSNIILRLSIAADVASSAGYSNIKIKDKMILMIKTLHTILGFSIVAILASLLCHPHQRSSSNNSCWSLVYMIFICLSSLIFPTYYSSVVSCFHWLHHTILALFHRLIQRPPNKEASTTSVEQANIHDDDVESLPV